MWRIIHYRAVAALTGMFLIPVISFFPMTAKAGPIAEKTEKLTIAKTSKSLYAVIKALPGHEEEVAKLLSNLAAEIRAEPGCVNFQVFRLADNPSIFHVDETYLDEKAFQAHIATEHGRKFNEAIKPLVEGGKSELFFLMPVA